LVGIQVWLGNTTLDSLQEIGQDGWNFFAEFMALMIGPIIPKF
jgi:hypothetical protein